MKSHVNSACPASISRTLRSVDRHPFWIEYLGNLFKQFPDMPQAVAASYNGGEDNVARWVTPSEINGTLTAIPARLASVKVRTMYLRFLQIFTFTVGFIQPTLASHKPLIQYPERSSIIRSVNLLLTISSSRSTLLVIFIALLLTGQACAIRNTPPARRFELHGKIVAINQSRSEVTISHGPIPGIWMR